jgi:hypothetical protein
MHRNRYSNSSPTWLSPTQGKSGFFDSSWTHSSSRISQCLSSLFSPNPSPFSHTFLDKIVQKRIMWTSENTGHEKRDVFLKNIVIAVPCQLLKIPWVPLNRPNWLEKCYVDHAGSLVNRSSFKIIYFIEIRLLDRKNELIRINSVTSESFWSWFVHLEELVEQMHQTI